MNTGVDALLPLAILLARVAANIGIVSLAVSHGFVTGEALGTDAVFAVRKTIRAAHSSVVHKCVGAEDKADLPVGVGSVEQQFFKATMFGNILLSHEHGTLVLHVS